MAKSDRLIDTITFHFCFAKCFRIFDVTTLVISFVEAMPPEILKNYKFEFSFSSLISKNSGQQRRFTMDDPAPPDTWIFWAGSFPWDVGWNLWLNLKSRPSRENRIRIPLFWSARINLHRSRRRTEDIRIIWMKRVGKIYKNINLQNIRNNSNAPNINGFSVRLL